MNYKMTVHVLRFLHNLSLCPNSIADIVKTLRSFSDLENYVETYEAILLVKKTANDL